MFDLLDSRKDDFDEGRSGVVGREVGRRVLELDRFTLLPRGLFEADIFIVDVTVRFRPFLFSFGKY